VPPLSRSVTDISNVSSKKPSIQIVVGDANIKGFDKTVFCKIVSIYQKLEDRKTDTTYCIRLIYFD
jgi:hypothetical protein